MTMKYRDPMILVVVLLFLSACSSPKVQPLPHPETGKSDQVDVLHGVSVPDPYRWLEDLDSSETKAWVEAQNGVTRSFLEQIPAREKIRQRLEHLWNYARQSAPFHRGSRWFQYRNDGLQDHAVLYWSDGMDGEQKVLLDPNKMSADGSVSLAGTSLSEDGRYIAYALSEGGSDWSVWRVRDITTGQDLSDRLEWVKFSGATWAKDGSGFWYARYPEPKAGQKMEGKNLHQKLYFHRLGDAQAADQLVFERPDEPEWGFGSTVTEDGEWLIISAWLGTDTRNRVFVQKLSGGRPASSGASVQPLITSFDGAYDFIGCKSNQFWFRTDAGAPKSRVIEVPVSGTGGEVPSSSWRTLIAETDDTLDDVRVIADRFIVSYQRNAYDRVAIFSQDGQHLSDLPLPGIGTVGSITGRPTDREMFFVWTSFTSPGQVWRFNFDTESMTSHWKATLPFDPDQFTTEQVWFTSKDGTKVPMFLTHRKDVAPNGNRPTYLYGYGGFNVSLPPAFSVRMLAWLEMGGVFAQANLRGGGEFGEAWHKAGMLGKKQNVFDDFIAAAEHLIDSNWTQSSRLAIGGGSNGGLLVGACMVQRPELFGACLPAVGVMDMLRFHKFTIGWAWEPEYGSPDNPEHFPFLHAYSPLHNLKPGTSYPPTMITTADHDDRVVPAHSFKFASALQAAHEGPAPMLIRIETKAGHGAGVPTSKQIEEAADRWAFLAWCFDLSVSDS